MGVPYNSAVVTEILQEALAGAPRGAKSDLARKANVSPSTVTKWIAGHTVPEPDRWPAVEEALGLPAGSIAERSGAPTSATPLGDTLGDHEQRIARLEATVRQLVEASNERYTLAAEGLPTEDDGDEVNRPAPPVEPDMHP